MRFNASHSKNHRELSVKSHFKIKKSIVYAYISYFLSIGLRDVLVTVLNRAPAAREGQSRRWRALRPTDPAKMGFRFSFPTWLKF